jgi:hypothetical protein
MTSSSLRTVAANVYLTALREGGSVPAVVQADDGRPYVVKFRGAAQGVRVLLAELVAGELARAFGLPVPELVLADVSADLGRAEPHPEIRAQLLASAGRNLGMAFLSGALGYEVAAKTNVSTELASRIVVFDAFVSNVDRTARNPNLLWWQGDLWMIDQGAAFYWQYNWAGSIDGAASPFALIRDHVLLPRAGDLVAAGEELRRTMTRDLIEHVLALVPEDWLLDPPSLQAPGERRARFAEYLVARRDATSVFVEEAVRAHAARA